MKYIPMKTIEPLKPTLAVAVLSFGCCLLGATSCKAPEDPFKDGRFRNVSDGDGQAVQPADTIPLGQLDTASTIRGAEPAAN